MSVVSTARRLVVKVGSSLVTNDGRGIDHAAVARRLIQIGKTDKDGGFEGVVPVPIAPAWNRPNVRVVVFVQNDKTGRIEAASTIGP